MFGLDRRRTSHWIISPRSTLLLQTQRITVALLAVLERAPEAASLPFMLLFPRALSARLSAAEVAFPAGILQTRLCQRGNARNSSSFVSGQVESLERRIMDIVGELHPNGPVLLKGCPYAHCSLTDNPVVKVDMW